MASRLAILGLLVAVLGGPPAAAQTPALPPPVISSPQVAPPDPTPRDTPYPNLPAAPRRQSGPAPAAPPLAAVPGGDVFLPDGAAVKIPGAKKQVIRLAPRYGNLGAVDWYQVEPNVWQSVYTGGIIINVTNTVAGPDGPELLEYEFATDNLVMWVKGIRFPNMAGGVAVDADAPADQRITAELFMKGNVVIRSKDNTPGTGGQLKTVTRTIRADQIYYDVDANRAIALAADLEMSFDGLPDSVHVYGKEIQRLGRREWKAVSGGAFSSKLPSDPAVRLLTSEAKLVERDDPATNFLGIPYQTLVGTPVGGQRILTARNARVSILGVPIFYTPYYRGDVTEPLGPLQGIGFGNDAVFGTQFYSTWDLYKLFALRAPPGHTWRLHADYLGNRGTGLGTDYGYTSPSFFGYGGEVNGEFKYYGLNDKGLDNIGYRGPPPPQPEYRFRAKWRQQYAIFEEREPGTLLPTGWQVGLQSQFAWVSDQNYLEQYFPVEFITGPNQETFAFLTASNGPVYASVLAEGGQRRKWVTETRALPRIDGAVVGLSLFDRLVYNARANAEYAELLPATQFPPPVLTTDQRLNVGRVNLGQELSLPVDVGPVRLAPYGILDLTGYTEDLTGESRGRLYGGGGLRAAVSASRQYSNVSSELFNLRGLNHKVTLNGNYFAAESNTPYSRLPQLDRLNDDQTDYSYRAAFPFYGDVLPPHVASALQTSPVFNPQQYAIRRLVDNKVDTLDDMQVVQLGVDQRLQTKRGYTGREHTVDWLTLNVSGSIFPEPSRDNYGKNWAFLEYNAMWNAGDRTAFQTAGWFDPFNPGTRYFNVGAYFARNDKTNFYFGYRQTDPLGSKAVVGNLYYQLTKKYAVSATTSYDIGIDQPIANTFSLIRTGTDLTVTFGITYNAIINNFGVQFAVLPNVIANSPYGKAIGSPQFGGR